MTLTSYTEMQTQSDPVQRQLGDSLRVCQVGLHGVDVGVDAREALRTSDNTNMQITNQVIFHLKGKAVEQQDNQMGYSYARIKT